MSDTISARIYAYEISYCVKGAVRPTGRHYPSMMGSEFTITDRNAVMCRVLAQLIRQNYDVLSVSTYRECVSCLGAGYTMVKPKMWRKKVDPPSWIMKRRRCEACVGMGHFDAHDLDHELVISSNADELLKTLFGE